DETTTTTRVTSAMNAVDAPFVDSVAGTSVQVDDRVVAATTRDDLASRAAHLVALPCHGAVRLDQGGITRTGGVEVGIANRDRERTARGLRTPTRARQHRAARVAALLDETGGFGGAGRRR